MVGRLVLAAVGHFPPRMAWLLLLSPALLPGAARSRHIVACLPDRTAASAADNWEAMFERLVEYQSEWGSADAVLGTELGRWCTTQRRLRSNGLLSDSKVQRLEELGMSWKAPTDIVPTESDWAEMCRRLAAYRAEQGDAQVPKKLKTDPELGGWVAAVRRQGPEALTAEELAAVEVRIRVGDRVRVRGGLELELGLGLGLGLGLLGLE